MPEEKSVADQFKAEIKEDTYITDPFNEAPVTEEVPTQAEEPQEDAEPLKNRRHRRLEERNRQLEDMTIALNERVKVLSEMDKFRSETSSDNLDEELARIYGTETPETKRATEILQKAFDRFTEKAETRALERLQEVQAAAEKEQREAESFIDNELEGLEDEFNVDLTSNSPAARKARTELLTLVERISPKDEEGNVKEYADFGEAFSLYQQTRVRDTRAKDLSSRSMVQSGASMPSKLEDDATQRALREMGII